MSRKNKSEIIAGIEIGSHSLKMKIAEISETGDIVILDLLRKPVPLGKDTFSSGKVSFETANKICEVLKGFKKIMNQYKIKNYRAVATSGIREAENRDYIIDQIKVKTGLNIDVISNSVERFLTYKAIREKLFNYKEIRNEGIMIVEIGSGSIEISVYTDDTLVFSQNIRLGPLRLREELFAVERRTLNFPGILEEYIESNIDFLNPLFKTSNIKNFIALGEETKIISKLCHESDKPGTIKYINKNDFMKLYQDILDKPTDIISKKYSISEESAHVLMPSMMLIKIFSDMTTAKEIYIPLVGLSDGVVSDLVDNILNTARKHDFISDIKSLAKSIAEKYHYDEAHADDVEEKSLKLFDILKKTHGLGGRERFLLQIAARLHDIGKYVNLIEHYNHSYSLIMSSQIIGLSNEELEIIANLAKYHSKPTPRNTHSNFSKLSEKNRVIVAKLAAIIRIADSLDTSHKQKIKDIDIILEEKEIIIKAEITEDALLEEWTFETKSEFFQEVFGITPILKVKRKI